MDKKIKKAIKASYLFPISKKVIENGLIIFNNDKIVYCGKFDLKQLQKHDVEISLNIEGTLIPGFVNAHTHLELSNLKNKIKFTKKGFVAWLKKFDKIRNKIDLERNIVIELNKLKKNGTVALGDISNSSTSYELLAKNKFLGVVFKEYYDNLGNKNVCLDNSQNIRNCVKLQESICPHAIYSTSRSLIEKILKYNKKNKKRTSIHFAEDMDEIDFYNKKTSKLKNYFLKRWKNAKIDSKKVKLFFNLFLKKYADENIILVHNVHLSEKDIAYLSKKQVHFVLCPRSNYHIGGKIPNLNYFLKKGTNVSFGTDSLASNNSLNVLEEIIFLKKYYKNIPSSWFLYASTYGGAKALGIEKYYGFRKGAFIQSIMFCKSKITTADDLINNKHKFKRLVDVLN